MSNYFINMDLKLHDKCYYSNVYVMDGGYSLFVENQNQYSNTGKYICEKDLRFVDE